MVEEGDNIFALHDILGAPVQEWSRLYPNGTVGSTAFWVSKTGKTLTASTDYTVVTKTMNVDVDGFNANPTGQKRFNPPNPFARPPITITTATSVFAGNGNSSGGTRITKIVREGYNAQEVVARKQLIGQIRYLNDCNLWCAQCLQALQQDTWQYDGNAITGTLSSMGKNTVSLTEANGMTRDYEIKKFSEHDRKLLWGYSRAHILRKDRSKINTHDVIVSPRREK
jgi:hypothetical protein